MEKVMWMIKYVKNFVIRNFRLNDDVQGACSVMVIVVGNGHGETKSNPGPS